LFWYGTGRVGGVRAVGVSVRVGVSEEVGVPDGTGELVTVSVGVGKAGAGTQAAKMTANRLKLERRRTRKYR